MIAKVQIWFKSVQQVTYSHPYYHNAIQLLIRRGYLNYFAMINIKCCHGTCLPKNLTVNKFRSYHVVYITWFRLKISSTKQNLNIHIYTTQHDFTNRELWRLFNTAEDDAMQPAAAYNIYYITETCKGKSRYDYYLFILLLL